MKTKTHWNKLLSLMLAMAMMVSLIIPAAADDIDKDQEQTTTYTYEAPTEPMEVDDNIITASAHRAASPILGIMGVNATSGFGMINGSAPTDLSEAVTCAALGVWGSSLNENPDPYYWNYFYNFYAEANGLAISDDALINTAAAASPVMADSTLVEEYGNISVSLYTRPDILVGCASTSSGSDTNGYDSQLATIASFYSYDEDGNVVATSEYYQEGDEDYDPQLVSYQTTTIKQMIESMYRLADAIEEVEEETGKTTRYGDVQEIATDYESYIYGIIAYVQEELAAKGLEEKTFAYVTAINDDGTYTVGGADYNSATSLGRGYEYGIAAATPMTTETTTMTLEELLTADVIITINNQNITQDVLLESFGDEEYDGIVISNTPSSLYGVTMNSVENAVGYAYVIGSMYADVLDIDPVELCAYFYEHFEHITDLDSLATVVKTNFADVILPDGVSATLSDTYSASNIEAKIIKGMLYYSANETLFDAEQFEDSGINEWTPNYSIGIAAGVSPFEDVSEENYFYDSVLWAVENGITTGTTTTTFSPFLTAERCQVVTFLWRAAGSPVVENVENPFTDVDEDDYFYNAVLWAVENGITTGTTETTFSPFETCERCQVVTFLYRADGSSVLTENTENPFTDVDEDDYFYNAVLWAVENGITTGTTETTFGPFETCERCMVVTFLYRYCA